MKRRRIRVVVILILAIIVMVAGWLVLRRRMLWGFGFLNPGMSFQELTNRLGEPDRDYGSGVLYVEYDLLDGRTVRMMFLHPDDLSAAAVCDQDGNCLELLDD